MVIHEVSIRPCNSPLGDTAAWVVLRDTKGVPEPEKLAFVWFKSAIHIDGSELIGLTLEEAHRLRHSKYSRNIIVIWDGGNS